MPSAFAFVMAMVVTMTTLPLLARVAGTLGLLDRPGGRKVHHTPIPRIGGLAMALGVVVAAYTSVQLEGSDQWFLLAIAVLVGFGVWDDRVDLDYRIKLIGQLIAVGIVVCGADVRIRAITLEDSIPLPDWVALPLTICFLVGITNAVNLADGLDGLAGGTSFLSLIAIALLCSATGTGAPPLLLAFAGAVLGFLRFNTYPASVFMGDAGSQLLGLSLGVFAIRATQADSTPMSAAIPVLVLAIPILDTLAVMVQRLSEGRSPFSADKNHIHHKLLALGFAHHEAVMVVYVLQASVFIAAYLLRFESDLVILAVVSGIFVATVSTLQIAARSGWSIRSRPVAQKPAAPRRDEALKAITRWSIALALGVYAGLIVAETTRLAGDVRLLVGCLLITVIVLIIAMRSSAPGLTEKCILFVTAGVLVFLDNSDPSSAPALYWASWACVGVTAAATAVRLRLLNDRRFQITPLDLIVLFMALVVPNLPVSMGLPAGGSAAIAKLVVLLYSIEILLSRTDGRVVWFRLGAVSVLASLMLRSLILP